MKKRLTIADVARTAGVSMMTVSRAINNKPGLSRELRQKILQIAAEMDYRPSKVARGLATQRTATVGLIIPSIINPFYAMIAQGVENIASESGYNVFLIHTATDVEREEAALDSLWAQHIEGAILCSPRLPQKRLVKIIERFPAVILFNRVLSRPLPNVVTICVNDKRAAQEAVQHLLQQGRKRIAYIGAPEDSYSSQCRLEGYITALKSANAGFDRALIMHIMPTTENGKMVAESLLSRHPDIDAILVFNDLTAIGVLQACQAVGKKVPEDVAVIGADDIPLASLVSPQLTTSRVNLTGIGRLAMQTLLEIFAGKVAATSYEIEPEMIIRQSG